jgi:D-alanyl-D-alanine dipeptidase
MDLDRPRPRPLSVPARALVGALGVLLTAGAVLLVPQVRAAVGVPPSGLPGLPATSGTPATDASPATGLHPDLADRFNAAQAAAAADGVDLRLVSGWRSAQEQQRLVDEALARHGDPAEAHRWVLPPEHSAHVQGLAVDVGAADGIAWLQEHGLEHGLCRTYANEAWHFEMLPDGAATCPVPLADASWAW